VHEKPTFRGAFKRTRWLIPISGYYEWKGTPDAKQPFCFSRVDGAPITVAGLWDEWRDIETGQPLTSCTMVITAPNDSRPTPTTVCPSSLTREASAHG
jgi:putative SOS response-associated peptidase YedK